jgi:hypothetical protein
MREQSRAYSNKKYNEQCSNANIDEELTRVDILADRNDKALNEYVAIKKDLFKVFFFVLI